MDSTPAYKQFSQKNISISEHNYYWGAEKISKNIDF